MGRAESRISRVKCVIALLMNMTNRFIKGRISFCLMSMDTSYC